MDWENGSVRPVARAALGQKYRRYRLADPPAEEAMAGSLRRWGQLSPVVACLRDQQLEVLDGFKRWTAAQQLPGLTSLSVRVLAVDERTAKAAILGLNHGQRATRELEEAWVVQALVRDDGLTQVEAAHLLGRHKSWVCRGLKSVRLAAAPDAAVGARLPLPQLRKTPLGLRTLMVGEFPEVVGKAGGQLPTPGTGNGVLAEPGAAHVWRFSAKKGQRLIVEVNARRLGSPLDSAIDILDGKGQPIPRATLRSLARTHVTFRDHDSVTAGIRLDNWNELAMNDYLYVGGELLRIKALPLNPDADCNFFSAGGQRVGYLDTTPTHHANGSPMYKVALHPPGTKFPPNGFPVVTLYYRNDDGGPGYGRDSRLFFDPPADGDYQVLVTDSRGQGGPAYAYRLTVRPPRPGFNVSVNPSKPAVWLGGAVPVTVNAERLDGFDGEIKVRLDKVPAGFVAPATAIGVDENSTTFALWADAAAKATPPLKLVAEAVIDGQKVVKTVAVGPVTTKAAGDLVTVTLEDVVTLRPGGEAKVRVRIERRNGFTGRVPLDVRGLPHGVRVLDIGLNGILITERETTRTVVLYAEPWVAAQERPFVVLARREGKNTEHAAKSVLLKVVAGGP